MEKHVGLNPAWFEPGPDGVSPFERISATVGFGAAGTAAAFRALLAQDAAQEPAPVDADAKDAEIARLTASLNALTSSYDEIVALNDARNDEIVGLRAEVERLKSECSEQQRCVIDLESAIERKETRIKVLEVANDSLTQYSSNLTTERDALRARIEAGVRVWSIDGKDWSVIHCLADNHTALLLDERPIAEADERKGKADRRETYLSPKHYDKRDYKSANLHATIECARSNDRRTTAGTIADRGQAS